MILKRGLLTKAPLVNDRRDTRPRVSESAKQHKNHVVFVLFCMSLAVTAYGDAPTK